LATAGRALKTLASEKLNESLLVSNRIFQPGAEMKILTIQGGRFFKSNANHLVEEVVKDMGALENSLVFSEPIKAEYGIFKASSSVIIGPKVGNRWLSYHTSGWLFNTSRTFLPRKSVESSELFILPAKYRLELDVPGSGLMELPGYRLGNGVVLLYIIPGYRFNFLADSLTLGDPENYVQLSINPSEAGFEGEVSLSLRKAEDVGVSIKGRIVEDVIFLGDESGKFSYNFISEPIIIVSHERILSPQNLQKALGVTSIVSGHGSFTLRLSMGRRRKDVEFSVELAPTSQAIR
jgi:hypothetical protein